MVSEKNRNYEYIKKFAKITVTKACDRAGVNRANFFNKKTSDENVEKVKNEIEKMLKEIEV